MRKYRKLLALGGGVLIAASGWMLIRLKEPGSGAKPPAAQTWDAKHEKIFLAEQLKRNPNHTPILLRLAQMERSGGDLHAARKYLEQAVAADGNQVETRLELGLVCSELGDFAAAEEQNRAILRIDPAQTDALYNLGALSANRGDVAQARKLWNDAIRAGNSSDGAAKAKAALARLEAMR